MNDSCIFCKIVKKEIPAAIAYEDERTVAFLDIFPVNTGHTLVIPKAHVPEFHKLPSDDYRAVFDTVQKVSYATEKAFAPKRVGLLVAGWDVPHTHVHVVPMNDYHDITSKKILEGTRGKPSQEELSRTAERLKSALA